MQKNESEEVAPSTQYRASKQPFFNMQLEFQSILDGHLFRINVSKHRIESFHLGTAPVHSASYREGFKAQELEKTEIDKTLLEKIFEPAQTVWVVPIVFLLKKDGTLGFCVDYRIPNAITKRDSYPFPPTNAFIDWLGNAIVFSMLESNNCSCQIEVEGADKDKTAISSHHGLCCIIYMPFGLQNAPGIFQDTVDEILLSVEW